MEDRKQKEHFQNIWLVLYTVAAAVFCLKQCHGISEFNYREALSKSLLYMEAQRSGHLPYHQRVTWRHHSGLTDGLEQGVDLVGGYYDAGDNVKFGLPMAFTITMLSWGVIQYGQEISGAGEYDHALEAIKWGTDYFIKAHTHPNVFWAEVGDGDTDHYCWQRPEDMTTSRHAYKVDEWNPGSDVAGETAAAMATASIVFRRLNPRYSHLLLHHAKQLFEFGDKYRGKYDRSIKIVKGYYPSVSGYMDELLWAALWLYKATENQHYLNYVLENAHDFGGITWAITEFSWDVKYAGLQIIVSMVEKHKEHKHILDQYRSKGEYYLCACLNKNNKTNVDRTPGGLLYVRRWNNMQYVSTAAFLLFVYGDYLDSTNQTLRCDRGSVAPREVLTFAKSQVDYILGSNPMATSYLVGYGTKFPQRVHHRGASIVSYKENKGFIGCTQGYDNWFQRLDPNPNVVVGALVGGPDNKDQFNDQRSNFVQTEACTYNSAALQHFQNIWLVLCMVAAAVFRLKQCHGISEFNYREALSKSLLYMEAQRSGRLPYHQRVTWRYHSGLTDGLEQGVDLVGGYYDAGDNVKFGLPMAFTITMLSWGVIQYGQEISDAGEYDHALEAIKWGTDYFIKAHTHPNVLWAEVGDGDTDHYCWQRPEDMMTSRHAYKVDERNPGSDVAGETAAAMATASIVFRRLNPHYSHLLLHHAKQLFEFGDMYRGQYDSSIEIVKGYYPSVSGYMDELLWAALWLYKATDNHHYLNYVLENAHDFGGITWAITEFSWDVKYAGLQIIVSMLMEEKHKEHKHILDQYRSKGEYYLCACLNKNNKTNVDRTPGGLLYVRRWNNMQYVSTAAFLLFVYGDYLDSTNQTLRCDRGSVAPREVLTFAKSQVDYILGSNPMATSYLVGYGTKFPQRVHHRGASIVSYKENKGFIGCTQGYDNWFQQIDPNPNVVVGALVGGPDNKDQFNDQRSNFMQTEACTYNSAALVGVFAKLHRLNNNDSMIRKIPLIASS
ncbi:hypothetical protein Ddye_027615 [Dipteronia dyeriana]|uniref:Endoglucanase n=1 Tax=Dipteronia dyeriana TaxID=168575 RepID=A0AAD9TQD7_9ROSI|nr:hypothetical protein Ddye_027615 [Dipteronia dyeriana]